MDFPLERIPSSQDCYDFLILLLHPYGFQCPEGHTFKESKIHRRTRGPIIDYRCNNCGRIYNIYTATILQGTKYSVQQIVQYIDGIIREVMVSQISRETGVGRKSLTKNKPRFKKLANMAENFEPQYINWRSVFDQLDLANEWEMKRFIDEISKHESSFLYWEAFLKNIEDWEVDEAPEDDNLKKLFLKVKCKGITKGYYQLSKTSYIAIDPESGKRTRKEAVNLYKTKRVILEKLRKSKF